MTTIAYDGKEFSADRQATGVRVSGQPGGRFDLDTNLPIGESYRLVRKIQVPPKPIEFEGSKVLVMAGSGSLPTIESYRKLLFDGCKLDGIYSIAKDLNAPFHEGCILVILTEAGLWEVEINQKVYSQKEIKELPYARGSGGSAALAMMKFVGIAASDAVGAASACDRYTGGQVDTWTREDPLHLRTYKPTEEGLVLLKKSIRYTPPKKKAPSGLGEAPKPATKAKVSGKK